MSAIAFNRTGFEAETSQAAPVSSPRPRDLEFRAALDCYMANYVAFQKRCADADKAAAGIDGKQRHRT